jgi:hypothetical protein
MPESTSSTSRATSVKPEELSEAVVRAVLRAIEVHPVGKKDKLGPWTLGIISNPSPKRIGEVVDEKRTGETVTIGVPRGLREGLTTDELSSLKSGGSLNNESLRKVIGKLTGNPQMGIKFANSLRQDFSGTMEQLFELTSDEQESMYIISQERPDGVDLFAQLLTETFKQGSQPQIEISKEVVSGSEGGSTARKVKFKLFIKAVCPPANPQNCNIEGGLEINF